MQHRPPHILAYIPAPTLPGDANNYSDNSQRNIANDNKFGERVDFNNQKTGNWSWYYHLDNANVSSANVNQGTGALPLCRASQRPRLRGRKSS